MKNNIDIIKIQKIKCNNYLKLISKKNRKIVININNRYVFKICNRQILLSQVIFSDTYKEIYEKIEAFNYTKSYMICKYEEDDTFKKIEKIDDMLREVKNIVSNYKTVNCKGYGDILNMKNTWYDFLKEEVEKNQKYFILDRNEQNVLNNSLKNIRKFNFQKKLIHGDLGCYNVIFKEQKIKKVIDARVIVGDPLYDYIFYIFSSSRILKNQKLEEIILKIDEPIEKIKSLMIIVLYNRIAVLIKNDIKINYHIKIWKEVIEL